jgi:hypothetical protein
MIDAGRSRVGKGIIDRGVLYDLYPGIFFNLNCLKNQEYEEFKKL